MSKKHQLPKKIKVNKEDIIVFDNISFYVDLTDYDKEKNPMNEGEVELEIIREDKKQYKFLNFDPWYLLSFDGSGLIPFEEKHHMSKYREIVNVFFKG